MKLNFLLVLAVQAALASRGLAGGDLILIFKRMESSGVKELSSGESQHGIGQASALTNDLTAPVSGSSGALNKAETQPGTTKLRSTISTPGGRESSAFNPQTHGPLSPDRQPSSRLSPFTRQGGSSQQDDHGAFGASRTVPSLSGSGEQERNDLIASASRSGAKNQPTATDQQGLRHALQRFQKASTEEKAARKKPANARRFAKKSEEIDADYTPETDVRTVTSTDRRKAGLAGEQLADRKAKRTAQNKASRQRRLAVLTEDQLAEARLRAATRQKASRDRKRAEMSEDQLAEINAQQALRSRIYRARKKDLKAGESFGEGMVTRASSKKLVASAEPKAQDSKLGPAVPSWGSKSPRTSTQRIQKPAEGLLQAPKTTTASPGGQGDAPQVPERAAVTKPAQVRPVPSTPPGRRPRKPQKPVAAV